MSHWAYRGEGNAHIVVSHKQKHIVYRMFKRKKNGISCRKKFKTDYQHLREKVLKYLAFTRNVMLPRIDKKYLHCGSLVEISPRLAQSIKASLANRPEYRKDKELDENCPYVLEMPDYCHVNQALHNHTSPHTKLSHPVYTIEIKPKWGFLPTSEYISAANRIKYSVCRYCMHQYQKIATGKWKHHSYYCPLDLFSGDRARMKHALKMMFATPQNNLRIFKDGKVLWNDLIHELRDNSEEIFLHEFFQGGEVENSQDIKSYRAQFERFLELLVDCLLHDGSAHETAPLPETTPLSAVIQNGHCTGRRRSESDSNGTAHLHDSDSHTNGYLSDSGSRINGRVFNSNLKECYINGHDDEILAQTCAASTYKKQNGYTFNPANNSKVSGLPKGCVLSQVLKVQLLDDIDIEGIQPLYEIVKQEMEQAKVAGKRCPFDFIGPYDANWCPTGAAPYTDTPDGIMYAVKKIKQFLVSRSAKDCSIMISIQQRSESASSRPVLLESSTQTPLVPALESPPPPTHGAPSTEPDPHGVTTETADPARYDPVQRSTSQKSDSSFLVSDGEGQHHLASIAVIDLDPKPFERLPSYIAEDREVVLAYTSFLRQRDTQL